MQKHIVNKCEKFSPVAFGECNITLFVTAVSQRQQQRRNLTVFVYIHYNNVQLMNVRPWEVSRLYVYYVPHHRTGWTNVICLQFFDVYVCCKIMRTAGNSCVVGPVWHSWACTPFKHCNKCCMGNIGEGL